MRRPAWRVSWRLMVGAATGGNMGPVRAYHEACAQGGARALGLRSRRCLTGSFESFDGKRPLQDADRSVWHYWLRKNEGNTSSDPSRGMREHALGEGRAGCSKDGRG